MVTPYLLGVIVLGLGLLAVYLDRRLTDEQLGSVSKQWILEHQWTENYGGVEQSGIQDHNWPIDKTRDSQGYWNAKQLKVRASASTPRAEAIVGVPVGVTNVR